jgi:glycosyltransferase involved in cell wall biosynthesis
MMTASIVIPVFNRARLVHRAIDSALSQTHPCEVVLVDHGSTDEIADVVNQYGDRIRYIRREVDNGPIACWRDGIEHATGEVVHITYDDDWVDPTFMARCLECLRSDVGLVYTRALTHFVDDGHDEHILVHPSGILPVHGLVQHLLRSPLPISPGCAVFRRRDALANLLLEVPGATGRYGKNSGVGEDLLIFLLTTLGYPSYAHVPEPLAHFTAHRGSITTEALSSGKGEELAQAYGRAKGHYCRQPGALLALDGIAKKLDILLWEARAGTLWGTLVNRIRRSLGWQPMV